MSGAVAIQGSIITLGVVSGPGVAAVFGGTRTIARAPLQLAGLITRPSLPELTRAQTAGDYKTVRRINLVNILVAVLATFPFAGILGLFGPELLYWVSRGQLSAPTSLFWLLAGATAANAVWMAAATPLIAENRQGSFSHIYLLLCGGVALTPLYSSDEALINLAAALFTAEAVCGVVVALALRRNASRAA